MGGKERKGECNQGDWVSQYGCPLYEAVVRINYSGLVENFERCHDCLIPVPDHVTTESHSLRYKNLQM
ncbi:MAG: hypothetical protein NPIRA06_04030 [Nitrospirales bacterium]|nr:MAG: hypothetical protein NPIRA06_04030 [Nitrospirales bacterium]